MLFLLLFPVPIAAEAPTRKIGFYVLQFVVKSVSVKKGHDACHTQRSIKNMVDNGFRA